QIGAEPRRGVTDLDGLGEAPGGIVVMRHGENELAVAERVKARPDSLRRSLIEESAVVALVCGVFLLHLRSALVIIVTLPLGILIALGVLAARGTSANLMSLAGF